MPAAQAFLPRGAAISRGKEGAQEVVEGQEREEVVGWGRWVGIQRGRRGGKCMA